MRRPASTRSPSSNPFPRGGNSGIGWGRLPFASPLFLLPFTRTSAPCSSVTTNESALSAPLPHLPGASPVRFLLIFLPTSASMPDVCPADLSLRGFPLSSPRQRNTTTNRRPPTHPRLLLPFPSLLTPSRLLSRRTRPPREERLAPPPRRVLPQTRPSSRSSRPAGSCSEG
jgi:hypothetical protein